MKVHMRRVYPWLLAATFIAAPVVAQEEPQDTARVVGLLAVELTDDGKVERYELSDTGSSVAQWLLVELDSRISVGGESPPPCPWGWTQHDRAFGYRLQLSDLEFAGDTAQVSVRFSCDNPPGYLHDIFGKRMIFWFRRTADGWAFDRKDLTWIT